MRRSRIELMLEILDSIRIGSHRITDLVYDVRANYVVVKKYLDLLEVKGLVESKTGKNIMFFLTEEGRTVLKKLQEREVLSFLEREPLEEQIEEGGGNGLRGM